jgi:hypothetical protein
MPISIPRSLWRDLSRAQLTALAPAADTDGCANIAGCGTGATCADVAAPRTGYTCACDAGFTGEGTANEPAVCVDPDDPACNPACLDGLVCKDGACQDDVDDCSEDCGARGLVQPRAVLSFRRSSHFIRNCPCTI